MSNLLGFERERCLEVIAAPQDGIRFIDALEAAVKLIAIVKTQDILSVCEKAKPEAEGKKRRGMVREIIFRKSAGSDNSVPSTGEHQRC